MSPIRGEDLGLVDPDGHLAHSLDAWCWCQPIMTVVPCPEHGYHKQPTHQRTNDGIKDIDGHGWVVLSNGTAIPMDQDPEVEDANATDVADQGGRDTGATKRPAPRRVRVRIRKNQDGEQG